MEKRAVARSIAAALLCMVLCASVALFAKGRLEAENAPASLAANDQRTFTKSSHNVAVFSYPFVHRPPMSLNVNINHVSGDDVSKEDEDQSEEQEPEIQEGDGGDGTVNEVEREMESTRIPPSPPLVSATMKILEAGQAVQAARQMVRPETLDKGIMEDWSRLERHPIQDLLQPELAVRSGIRAAQHAQVHIVKPEDSVPHPKPVYDRIGNLVTASEDQPTEPEIATETGEAEVPLSDQATPAESDKEPEVEKAGPTEAEYDAATEPPEVDSEPQSGTDVQPMIDEATAFWPEAGTQQAQESIITENAIPASPLQATASPPLQFVESSFPNAQVPLHYAAPVPSFVSVSGPSAFARTVPASAIPRTFGQPLAMPSRHAFPIRLVLPGLGRSSSPTAVAPQQRMIRVVSTQGPPETQDNGGLTGSGMRLLAPGMVTSAAADLGAQDGQAQATGEVKAPSASDMGALQGEEEAETEAEAPGELPAQGEQEMETGEEEGEGPSVESEDGGEGKERGGELKELEEIIRAAEEREQEGKAEGAIGEMGARQGESGAGYAVAQPQQE